MSRNRRGILTSLAALVAMGWPSFLPTPLGAADDRVATRSTPEGTWHKVEGQLDHYKFIAGTKYINTWVKDGVLVHAFGGKCRIQGNQYTETVEFVAPTAKLGTVGASATFQWTVTGDTLRIVGDIDGGDGKKVTLDQKFERVK